MSKEKRVYVLYDSRAANGDTSEASVLVVCDSNEEAKGYRGEYGSMSCYSYREEGDTLVDETLEWSWFK